MGQRRPPRQTQEAKVETQKENADKEELVNRPRGQKIFDNIALWFVLSLVFSLVLYNGWGLLELLFVPPAP